MEKPAKTAKNVTFGSADASKIQSNLGPVPPVKTKAQVSDSFSPKGVKNSVGY